MCVDAVLFRLVSLCCKAMSGQHAMRDWKGPGGGGLPPDLRHSVDAVGANRFIEHNQLVDTGYN